MWEFLIWSLVASVVLTVLLNVVVRLFPRATDRAAAKLAERLDDEARVGNRRVRVWIPWRAMVAISIGLTVLVNLVALIAR